jgi:3-deoxy-D-manno-octulosonic-acid transferase
VQTSGDAKRIAALLGGKANIHVTGNCKFDVEIPPLDEEQRQALAGKLGLPWPARIIVAGSTHPGEEEIMLRALAQLSAAQPDLNLALVPRHPERFAEVWELVLKSGLGGRRTSDGATAGPQPARVHLVDQMGVLTQLYGLAEVAVVAGSFVPGIGGHNILEPAAHGVPVVYGPYMKSQPDMVRIMAEWDADGQVTAEGLVKALGVLLDLPAMAAERGESARAAYLANRGAAARSMQVIEQYL